MTNNIEIKRNISIIILFCRFYCLVTPTINPLIYQKLTNPHETENTVVQFLFFLFVCASMFFRGITPRPNSLYFNSYMRFLKINFFYFTKFKILILL